ncbi:MAG: COR domain-containing protein [Bacteroidota bacterium]
MTSLYLDGNNLHTPPPEIISKGLEAIKSYFAEQEKGKPQPLYEARVLFVGQPGAGKTTLMRKLIDPTYQVPQEQESTVGIHIHKGWEFDCIPSPSGKFQANLWDFGGQEIQYQIHHFFLSSRVLYVLLADNRRQDTEFDYWFDIIQRLGLDQNKKASPVLVVLNENQHKSVTNYDEEHYNRLYPDLPKVKGEVDLSEPHDPKRKIWNGRYLDVRQKICSMLQGLDHVGDLLPQSWVEVRQDIEKLADTYKHIGLTKYQEVCVSKGIENERDQLVLSQYLHDLGLMLHFQHDEALVEFIILQPQWAVNAIYDILSDQEIEKSEGQFTQEWLYSRWGKQYTNREKGKLLTMMKKDQFDLIHQVKNVKDTYMVPSLMSDKDPQNDWNYRGNLRYRYQYGFMPKGLVPRLAVRLGDFTQYIAGKPQTWKKGVILEYEGAIAKIELSYYDDAKGIGISIQGGATERKILLERIRMEMPKLHEKFKDFPPKELIPCHCPVCEGAIEPNYYKVEELKGYLEGGEQEVYCIKGKQRVNILGLIGGVMDYSYSSEQTHPTMEFGVKNSDSSPNIREDKLIELLKLAIVNSNNPNALQVNVNQQVAQTNKVNIHLEIRQDWVDLQSHFEDFKDWMLEEVAPEDEAKLEKIQDKLDQTQGNEEAIQKSGLMPKVKRYLEKKLGATSALGDKLSKIQKGREAIEKLADSFNKLAKNLGLDQLDPTDLIP